MTLEEIIYTIGTALAGALTWFFASNIKLREGMSDWVLKTLNKTHINKIPLLQHKLFSLLRQKESSMAYFIIDEPVKIAFYKIYVKLVFSELKLSAEKIANSVDDKDIVLANLIHGEVNALPGRINTLLMQELIIPDNVKTPFMQWRVMINESLKDTLTEILNDDLVDSNYFMAYRALDVLIAHIKFILSSGALEFSKLNGGFKGLELKDILKNENQSNNF